MEGNQCNLEDCCSPQAAACYRWRKKPRNRVFQTRLCFPIVSVYDFVTCYFLNCFNVLCLLLNIYVYSCISINMNIYIYIYYLLVASIYLYHLSFCSLQLLMLFHLFLLSVLSFIRGPLKLSAASSGMRLEQLHTQTCKVPSRQEHLL